MPRPAPRLVIDARPRGPRGPLADERVLGRSVLAHLLDLALSQAEGPVVIHARLDEHRQLHDLVADLPPGRLAFATGPPSEDAAILRTDRLYDPARLRRVLRKGLDPESAVLWRLDQPHALEGVEDELRRRRSYQPLGRYWALAPARSLARFLRPTRVRPNALTMASAALMLAASGAVALAPSARFVTAAALAMALVLDTADGHLARLQGTASEFGRWLDAFLDELGDMALHAAIAWAAFVRDGQYAWLLVGMVYGMGKYMFVVGATATNTQDASRPEETHPPPNPPPQGGRALIWPPPPLWGRAGVGGSAGAEGVPERLATLPRLTRSLLARLVRLAGHADIRWHLWIILAALGRLDAALVAYAAYFPARALAGAVRKGAKHG